jgi:hypothetical protein
MKLPDWFYRWFWRDETTWFFHGLQGVLALLYTYWLVSRPWYEPWMLTASALLYFFGAREIPGIIETVKDFREAIQPWRALRDGVFDLLAPFVGMGLGLLLWEVFL